MAFVSVWQLMCSIENVQWKSKKFFQRNLAYVSKMLYFRDIDGIAFCISSANFEFKIIFQSRIVFILLF